MASAHDAIIVVAKTILGVLAIASFLCGCNSIYPAFSECSGPPRCLFDVLRRALSLVLRPVTSSSKHRGSRPPSGRDTPFEDRRPALSRLALAARARRGSASRKPMRYPAKSRAKLQNSPDGRFTCLGISFKMALATLTISPTRAPANFAFVSAMATGLLSMPIEGRPRSRAAKFVVPLPQKGSATQSPFFARPESVFKGNSSGNIVKYGQMPFALITGSVSLISNKQPHFFSSWRVSPVKLRASNQRFERLEFTDIFLVRSHPVSFNGFLCLFQGHRLFNTHEAVKLAF